MFASTALSTLFELGVSLLGRSFGFTYTSTSPYALIFAGLYQYQRIIPDEYNSRSYGLSLNNKFIPNMAGLLVKTCRKLLMDILYDYDPTHAYVCSYCLANILIQQYLGYVDWRQVLYTGVVYSSCPDGGLLNFSTDLLPVSYFRL